MCKKQVTMCLMLMLLAPMSANAQFGKLKNVVKDAAKGAVTGTTTQQRGGADEFNRSASEEEQRRKWAEMDAQKLAREKQDQLQKSGQYKAAAAQLTDEQRWGLEQLATLKEAPYLPFLMDQKDKLSFPESMSDVRGQLDTHSYLEKENLEKLSIDSVQRQKAQMDARYAYNKRVLAAVEGLNLSLYAEDYNTLDVQKRRLLGETVYYQAVPAMLAQDLTVSFSEWKLVKNDDGSLAPSTKAILLPFCQGHPVQFDMTDKKYKFYQYKQNPTYADEAEVKRQEKSLGYLRNLAALLSDRDPSKQSETFYKAVWAEWALKCALANNTKDNITYKERPKGSALNTPELRAEALRVLQKRFPGAGYEEVIITGDHWVNVVNIFGIVIERWVDVAAVMNGGIAKQIMYLSVGNDRIGSGWGSLHLYGITGDGPYVK